MFLRQGRPFWILWAVFAVPFLTAYFLVQEVSYVGLLEFTAREIYQEVKTPQPSLLSPGLWDAALSLLQYWFCPTIFWKKRKASGNLSEVWIF